VIASHLLLLFGVGSLAGLLAGFFGVGGGVILGPFLLFFLQAQGLEVNLAARLAFGTSLFCAFFNSVFSVYRHNRQRNVEWRVVPYLAVSAIVGAYLGSSVASQLPGEILKKILALVLVVLAVQVFFGVGEKAGKAFRLDWRQTVPIGFLAGFFAAMAGIGGGVFFVPALILFVHLPVKKTAGTSSAIIIFTTFAAAVGYFIHGLGTPNLPPGCLGYVYALAAAPILLGSLFFSQLGAYLNSVLPPKWLRAFFGVFLFGIFLKLVF